MTTHSPNKFIQKETKVTKIIQKKANLTTQKEKLK